MKVQFEAHLRAVVLSPQGLGLKAAEAWLTQQVGSETSCRQYGSDAEKATWKLLRQLQCAAQTVAAMAACNAKARRKAEAAKIAAREDFAGAPSSRSLFSLAIMLG